MKLSANAIDWLNKLFQERISKDIALSSQDHDLQLSLSLPGSSGTIRFVRECRPATGGRLPLAFATWDPADAGLPAGAGKPLIAPAFTDQAPRPAVERAGADYVVHYDLLWLFYWQLTRLEEFDSPACDHFGRFPASASFAAKHGYLERPIVDEWFAVLAHMAQRVWPQLALRVHQYRLEPTQDVDFPSRYAYISLPYFLRMAARDLIHDKKPLAVLNGVRIRLASLFTKTRPAKDPFDTFDWIMRESEQRGLTSIFYFMCKGQDRLDPGYSPGHPAIRDLIRQVHARGHQIGLHPSFRCLEQSELLTHEANTIRQILRDERIDQAEFGSRMHYYHCRYPHTFRQLEQAGLTHDATMGYADHVGFRAGTCIPYQAFDAESDRLTTVTVKPLVLMESTLYAPAYMNLTSPDACLEKATELAAVCRSVGGVFNILWHNSEFMTEQQRQLYTRILDLH